MEHWTSAGGSEGKSLFYVDTDTRNWKQIWVTVSANMPWGQKEKEMLYSIFGEKVVFQGSYLVNSKKILDRTILSRMETGDVKQEIQTSVDGGLTWRTGFIGIYKKH